MKRVPFATIAAGVLALAGPLASADKAFTAEKTATWDCAKDPKVTITHGSGKYVVKGACQDITVNGGHNVLTIEAVATLTVNGSSNAITADRVDAIGVTGSNNQVSYRKSGGAGGKPAISSLGQNNAITPGT